MQKILPFLILALICIPSGYGMMILLVAPAWLRGQENPDPRRPMRLEVGCLYVLTAPLRLFLLYLWQLLIQPLVRLAMVMAGIAVAFILQFGPLARIGRTILDTWVNFSQRLWSDNLNAENLFNQSGQQAVHKARGYLEQVLMQRASVQVLQRSFLFASYDFLGVKHAVPTVLAAIASDESRQLEERVQAVNVLGRQGYRSLLLSIAKNTQRSGAVVRQAAENLELFSDWRGAHQAWRFLLEHREPEIRLLAANHLKLDPNLKSQAASTLRTLFRDERSRLDVRIEAAAALGRVKLLGDEGINLLYEWMNNVPDHTERLHAAFILASLWHNASAMGKLRRYSYEIEPSDRMRSQSLEQRQKAEEVERLRALAIHYLGRLGQVDLLRPLGRMEWIEPVHRLRIAEILQERGHALEAARNRLALSQDAKAPPAYRHKALELAVSSLGSRTFGLELAENLVDVLARLGSDSEPSYTIRLEAARRLASLGMADPARNILLVLAHGSNPEPAIRKQAAHELRRLSSLTF